MLTISLFTIIVAILLVRDPPIVLLIVPLMEIGGTLAAVLGASFLESLAAAYITALLGSATLLMAYEISQDARR